MRPKPNNLSRLTTPVILGLVAGWVGIVTVSWIAAREIDASGHERDARLAASALRLVGDRESALARDYAYWNDAIRNLVLEPDSAWAASNIGGYLHRAYGVSSVFVAAADGTTVMGFEDGMPTGAQAFDMFSPDLAGLIAESEASSVGEPVPAHGLFATGGRLHLVVTSVFMQENPADGLDLPRPLPALVISRALDDALLAQQAELLQLPGLAIVAERPGSASLPLMGRDGATLGYLVWNDTHTGSRLLHLLAVPIAVTLLFTVLFVLLFWRRAREIFRTQEALRAASQAKDRFLSSMSHELRTPLNAILGFGQLLDQPENPLNAEQRGAARHILQAGDHLLRLVNQVLDLAEVESGNLHLFVEPLSWRAIVEPSLTMARSMGRTFDVTVGEPTVASGLPPVVADLTRGKQVLLNLLSNAVKYNRRGGRVDLDIRPTGDGLLRFAVTDTGPGIPVDKKALLFTPFNRLVGQDSTVEGTGVGLAITRELVSLMGGRIGVDGTPGRGSTFWFELPAADAEAADPGVAEAATAPEAAVMAPPLAVPESCSPGKSVLYVEDNPANAELMQRIIALAPGVTCEIAGSAELGLRAVARSRPDLILMDINLPGISGIEACRILKSHAATADIPVVAVTASTIDAEESDAGFAAFIPKPFRVADVRATIARLLDKASTGVAG